MLLKYNKEVLLLLLFGFGFELNLNLICNYRQYAAKLDTPDQGIKISYSLTVSTSHWLCGNWISLDRLAHSRAFIFLYQC